ncbi:MAG: urea transport system permease protein [Alphaproteobacteria bacterium]|jgi:urea ABC transporter permease protein UrtC|nr:urea transport system permease protein [Alphaproteobacteria bacterium]
MTPSQQADAPRRWGKEGFWRGETLFAIILFAALALLPMLAGGYIVYILPQYLLFGMLAMSLALLWGFVGILSFGQAAFFALGAYALGLALGHWGPSGSYVGLLAAPLLGGLLAALAGYFLFSAGVRATYFVLVTLALSIIVEQIAVSQSQITGGWNGLFVDRIVLSFGPLGTLELFDDYAAYFFILPVVALAYVLLRWATTAKFGKVLVGIRENEDRLTALGYDISLYKTAAFALSGAVAGLAGALYGMHANFVSPSLAGVLFSTEVVVWVAIGGRISLIGALAGGVIVSSISNYLSSIIPDYWQLALGVIFILVIIFFKEGFAGAVTQTLRAARRRRQ